MTTAALDVADRCRVVQQRLGPRGYSGPPLATLIKYLVFGTLGVLVVIYIGPGEIGEMLLKIAVALASVARPVRRRQQALRPDLRPVGAFNAIGGFVVGFVLLLVLDGNRLLRDLSPRPWAWAAIGGVALGAVMLAHQRTTRATPCGCRSRSPGSPASACSAPWRSTSRCTRASTGARCSCCTAIGVGVGVLVRLLGGRREPATAAPRRRRRTRGWRTRLARRRAGAGAELAGGGTSAKHSIATVVPLAAIGLRFGLTAVPAATERREIEQRSRSWIFVTPALAFVAGGLLVPLMRTIYISFKGRDSAEFVGTDNYQAMFQDPNFFDVDNWPDIFTSQLWWFGVFVIAAGVLIGVVGGRTTKRVFESGPTIAPADRRRCLPRRLRRAVRAARDPVQQHLVGHRRHRLGDGFGLAAAVLADRAGGENVAKSMIFLPMAISFVGAGVIWRFMYQTRNVQEPQTGVLNAIWVGLGELSNSGWQKWLVAVVLAAIIAGLAWLAWDGVTARQQHPRRVVDRRRSDPRLPALSTARPRSRWLPDDRGR